MCRFVCICFLLDSSCCSSAGAAYTVSRCILYQQSFILIFIYLLHLLHCWFAFLKHWCWEGLGRSQACMNTNAAYDGLKHPCKAGVSFKETCYTNNYKPIRCFDSTRINSCLFSSWFPTENTFLYSVLVPQVDRFRWNRQILNTFNCQDTIGVPPSWPVLHTTLRKLMGSSCQAHPVNWYDLTVDRIDRHGWQIRPKAIKVCSDTRHWQWLCGLSNLRSTTQISSTAISQRISPPDFASLASQDFACVVSASSANAESLLSTEYQNSCLAVQFR